MMRAELNHLLCTELPELDLRCWAPERGPGAVWVQMLIGPTGTGGGESFALTLCTPEWIASEARASGIFNASHHVVVADFDYEKVEKYLMRKVSACQGETWQAVADQLRTFSYWEFDNYQAAKPMPQLPPGWRPRS